MRIGWWVLVWVPLAVVLIAVLVPLTMISQQGTALWYLAGVPVLGTCYLAVYLPLLGSAVAIGDSANPVLSVLHVVMLNIMSFPMMLFWKPLGGDLLKKWLTDNGAMFLFVGIEPVVWGTAGTKLVHVVVTSTFT